MTSSSLPLTSSVLTILASFLILEHCRPPMPKSLCNMLFFLKCIYPTNTYGSLISFRCFQISLKPIYFKYVPDYCCAFYSFPVALLSPAITILYIITFPDVFVYYLTSSTGMQASSGKEFFCFILSNPQHHEQYLRRLRLLWVFIDWLSEYYLSKHRK